LPLGWRPASLIGVKQAGKREIGREGDIQLHTHTHTHRQYRVVKPSGLPDLCKWALWFDSHSISHWSRGPVPVGFVVNRRNISWWNGAAFQSCASGPCGSIVTESESVCHPQHTQIISNSSTIATDNNTV
jgi:hypothetical protein